MGRFTAFKLGSTLLATYLVTACTMEQVANPPVKPINSTPLPVCTPPTPTPSPAPIVRYQESAWEKLPNWPGDQLVASFTTWKASCVRLKKQAIWQTICADADKLPADASAIHEFMESRLKPLRLQNDDGSSNGLITGYYEPIYPGSLQRSSTARYPLYAPPKNMITVALDSLYPELKGKRLRGVVQGQKLVPYPSRAEIASKGLDAPVLAWLNDPVDVQFMQVQGSGRVLLDSGKMLRIGYADQNGHPYTPVGRWLVQQGIMPASDVTMQSIRNWANKNPSRVEVLLDSNPSYVFFRTLPDSLEGPIGSLGIPLNAEHSIAVDVSMIPLGSPVFINTSRPDNQAPLQKLVAAQDTGGAIKGSVRADFFWGTGSEAGELAGRMKQSGELWLLWPKEASPPQ